jgi:beta-glucanase (GH16 family)
MSQRESHTSSTLSGRRGRRGVRWSALALALALAVTAGCLTSCTTAEKSGTPQGDTPVTVIASAAAVPASTVAVSNAGTATLPGYKLVFDEEFDGSKLNLARWATTLPWGSTNHDELQYYRPSALSVGRGMLTITASKRPTGGKPYTSGAISTYHHFAFTYGRAEMRAQVPAGSGLWSAFWLLARTKAGNEEADIMELIGQEPNTVDSVLHYGTMVDKGRALSSFSGPDFSSGWHTFALDWEPGIMIWYIDGVERFRATRNVPSDPMIVIANLTVGGPGSWPGAPDRYTAFPARYKIDYIRVFQHD